MLSSLKNYLLRSGPNSPAVKLAFWVQAASHGVLMSVSDKKVTLTSLRRAMILGRRDLISVPFAIHSWDMFFDTLEGEVRNGKTVLDFSEPALHRFRKNGLSFYFPSIAEDDCLEAYTASYSPQPGDVVWDVGAHAGTTTYNLSQMVGPTGKVFAFEPDEASFEFLLRNIEMHKLSNVTPVKAALSDKTGTANFCMDGTMGAGLVDSLSYRELGNSREVKTLSFRDACEQLGSVPKYVKVDIEGAELAMIEGALDFLKEHPVHLVFESNHVVDGKLTSGPLDLMLGNAGYRAWSSDEYGQRFTWAEPPQ